MIVPTALLRAHCWLDARVPLLDVAAVPDALVLAPAEVLLLDPLLLDPLLLDPQPASSRQAITMRQIAACPRVLRWGEAARVEVRAVEVLITTLLLARELRLAAIRMSIRCFATVSSFHRVSPYIGRQPKAAREQGAGTFPDSEPDRRVARRTLYDKAGVAWGRRPGQSVPAQTASAVSA